MPGSLALIHSVAWITYLDSGFRAVRNDAHFLREDHVVFQAPVVGDLAAADAAALGIFGCPASPLIAD